MLILKNINDISFKLSHSYTLTTLGRIVLSRQATTEYPLCYFDLELQAFPILGEHPILLA